MPTMYSSLKKAHKKLKEQDASYDFNSFILDAFDMADLYQLTEGTSLKKTLKMSATAILKENSN